MSGMQERTTTIGCRADEGFVRWLALSGGAVAISTYQAGKVAMVGWDGRQLCMLMRHFDKPLGLAVSGDRLALATRHDIVFFANARLLAADYLPEEPGKYDALYLPRASYHTGDLNVHDVAFCGEELLFANTLFSCISRLSKDYSFEPVWVPPFISDLVPEDRCHLNGVAVVDGRPAYVTAHGATDSRRGWHEHRVDGGIVVDVERDRVAISGLSMPHSPRWAKDRLWFLNSGWGQLVAWDPESGKQDVICSLPGYTRGLCILERYALVGLSKIREKHIFGGMPVQEQFDRLCCGVAVVDIEHRAVVGMLEFTSGCEEIYEVQFLPGIRRPTILNLERPAVRQAFTNPESSFWLRPVQQERRWEQCGMGQEGGMASDLQANNVNGCNGIGTTRSSEVPSRSGIQL